MIGLRAVVVSLCLVLGTAQAQTVPVADSTGSVAPDGVFLPPHVSTLAQAFGSAASEVDDPRIIAWIALKNAGQYRGLVSATEADLRSDAPHPYASHIWSWAQWKLGALTENELPEIPVDLIDPLNLAAQVFANVKSGRTGRQLELIATTLARKTPLYWVDYEVGYAACGAEMLAACREIGRRLVTHFPRDFGAAYLVGDYAATDAQKTMAWLNETPALLEAPAGKLIMWMLAQPDDTAVDRRELAKFWLEVSPNDPNALRRLGYQFETLFYPNQALTHFVKEHAVYPFRDAPLRVGRILASQLKFDETKDTARAFAVSDTPQKMQDLAAAKALLRIYRHSGQYGRARRVGLAALQSYPEDGQLRVLLARTVREEGFPNEAVVTVAPVLEATPAHYEAANQITRALDAADRHRDLLEVIERYRTASGAANENLFNNWNEALHNLEQDDQLDELLEIIRSELPEAQWLQGNVAWAMNKFGRTGQAYEIIAGTIMQNPNSDWRVARITDYGKASGQADAALSAIEAFVARYPYRREGWKQLAKLTGDAKASWSLALEKAPGKAFPAIELAGLMAEHAPSDWHSVQGFLQKQADRMADLGVSGLELAKVYHEKAQMLDDAALAGHLTSLADLDQGFADLDQARDLGLELNEYWSLRYFLLSRLGASPERTMAAIHRLRTHPDEKDAYGHLFSAETMKYLGTEARAFVFMNQYVERRPRSAERLKSLAHRHNKWGGSSVVALALMDRVKRWDADADVDSVSETAYSALGAHKRFYETRYNRGASISNSQRYVNWFETAREKTQRPQSVLKSLDFETMTVTQIRPDGIEWVRRYDPIIGRLIWFRLGAVKGELTYTDDGYLAGFRIGNSKPVDIEYEPATAEGLQRQISVLRVGDGRSYRFEYNADAQPVVIEVEGIGLLRVTYDEFGETSDVVEEMEDPDASSLDLSFAIQNAFARLVEMGEIVRDVQLGEFSALEVDDPDLELASAKVDSAWDDPEIDHSKMVDIRLELARLLISKASDHPDHMHEAEAILAELFFELTALSIEEQVYSDEPLTPQEVAKFKVRGEQQTLEVIGLWRKLMLRTRPDGMPQQDWQFWSEMQEWVDQLAPKNPETIGAAAQLQAEMQQGGLTALSNAGWLKRSHLTNPGFWRTHKTDEVFPSVLTQGDLRIQDILVRHNGDVVVAGTQGFAVLRRGFWEWFGFDQSEERFSANSPMEDLGGKSNILALAEDGQDRLWIGTRAGLFLVADDYDDPSRFWRSGDAGFLQGAIETLAVNETMMAVGGAAGMVLLDTQNFDITNQFDEPVERLRAADQGWLVVGRNGLWWQTPDQRLVLSDYHVTDVVLDEWAEQLFVLRGKSVLVTDWQSVLDGTPDLQAVPGQETIAATDMPFGLAWVEVMPGETGLVVLTDQGGSVMGNGAFETFSQPGTDRPVGVEVAHERDGRLFMITSEGVSAVVRGQAQYPIADRVYDLLSDSDLAATFVATGHSIQVIDHDAKPAWAEHFSGINARILEAAPDGGLITHDGPMVVRFDPGEASPRELFDTQQIGEDEEGYAAISDILAASDGSVWAVAGASVFRFKDGDELREFSMFDAPADYPVRSDMLFAIHENIDGRILLVASNEGHRNFANRNMYGGLFEYRDGSFVKTDLDVLGSWFLTSMTVLDDDTAIAGTNSGFARVRGSTISEFDQLEDASYMALKSVQPALYLGTQGAKLGEDLWLFGTASGVVALKGNTWFSADRLNWMLPEQEFANYGARVVHAVATDPSGRVYVGTDGGLTVYDPDGAGAESFLISERRGDFAFSALEQDRMRAVSDILLDALPADSKAGKLAGNFRKTRQQIAKLEEQLSIGEQRGSDVVKQLEKKLLKTRQRDIAILAKLERDAPLLFNMLQLNPLDLRALSQKLPPDVVVAQYLPTKTTLYINLVDRDGATLKTVSVGLKELEQRARLAANSLAAQARGEGNAERSATVRAFDVNPLKKNDPADTAAPDASIPATKAAAVTTKSIVSKVGLSEDATDANLAWLYDRLLRPIEHDVPEGTTLVISPAGALAYLPFAALVRSTGAKGPQYAVQHFNLAHAPSLYAVDMMIDAVPSGAFSHVVFGDPDGTLPFARQEAEAISEILAEDIVELRIGDEATYDALQEYSGDARFVHLAMHGKLDHESPKDSYLLLADNRRMSIPQIMTLPMQETDLVFLSACESGLGTDGLEYRTIAHAFAHAGAPAVVATLWQVDDAATSTLAEGFYLAKTEGMGNAQALRHVQREMISTGGKHAQPGYWAGMTLFGQP